MCVSCELAYKLYTDLPITHTESRTWRIIFYSQLKEKKNLVIQYTEC